MVSILNGLSQMGAGVAQYAGQAGAEAQKADLNQQAITLASQLAGAREAAGRAETAGYTSQQLAQTAGYNTALEAQRAASAEKIAATGAAATLGAAGIQAGATTGAATIAASASPEANFLRFIGYPGAAAAVTTGSGGSAAMPAATSAVAPTDAGTAATAASTGPSVTGAPVTTGAGSNTTTTSADPLGQRISQLPATAQQIASQVLHIGLPGSDVANRIAVAHQVDADMPDATPGAKAVEVMMRLAQAEGKMISADQIHGLGMMIASYQIAPPTGRAYDRPGMAEALVEAKQINPDYQATRYEEIADAMKRFGAGGPEGQQISYINRAAQHMDSFDVAAKALGNGDFRLANYATQEVRRQLGFPELTNVEALRQLVGAEVEKGVSGSVGALADREALMKSLNGANSPAQLQGATDQFRGLMYGQYNALKRQYVDSTGITSGPFAFDNKFDPAAIAALRAHAVGASQQPGGVPAASTISTSAAPQWQYSATGDKGLKAYSNDGQSWFNQDGSPIAAPQQQGR